jgi:flagellin-like hook-associated protein FlgL
VDAQIRSLQEELINLTEAQSEVEDVDYASEVSEFVRRQVLTAAADFVMKMTMDLQKQGVLSLLGAR